MYYSLRTSFQKRLIRRETINVKPPLRRRVNGREETTDDDYQDENDDDNDNDNDNDNGDDDDVSLRERRSDLSRILPDLRRPRI